MEKYMKYALELAKRGRGNVAPNPLVGAVIVKNCEIIGEGFHQKYGDNHAEINAFEDADKKGNDVTGSEMYVTLEPCSHFGKTPPCANEIVRRGIKKVYIGMLDPNPLVVGNGVEILKNAGIEVEIGILEEECRILNEVFIKYITKKTPFVVLKTAMSLDGKIATYTGDSKWISCKESRNFVQKMRGNLTGIMVGINTVLADDPLLTVRDENIRDPIRIIVDSKLSIPLNSKVLELRKNDRCIVATTEFCDSEKEKLLTEKGVEIIKTPMKNKGVDLIFLMKSLGEKGVDSLLLEGGGTLNFSALKNGIVDKAIIFIAPMFIGGDSSKTPVEGKGVEDIKSAILLENTRSFNVGRDFVLEGYIKR